VTPPEELLRQINLICLRRDLAILVGMEQDVCYLDSLIDYLRIYLRVWLIEHGYFPGTGKDDCCEDVGVVARSKISKTTLMIRPIDSAAARVSDWQFCQTEH
jgi:hypothetical protein